MASSLTADDFPRLLAAVRELRNAIIDPNSGCSPDWGILTIRAGVVRRILAGETLETLPFLFSSADPADLDPSLPLRTRAKFGEVWRVLDAWLSFPPCAPREVRNQLLTCLEEAEELLAASLTPPDGPEPPDKFRWRGNVCPGLSPLQYRLLAYLWDDGGRRKCVDFGELLDHVWEGKNTLPTSIKSFVSRLNTKLNTDGQPQGIYLGLATENYNVVCSWGQ